MRKIILIIPIVLSAWILPAQNLIPNGGFESYTLCPDDYGQLQRATGWINPNGSSPDYLNRCAPSGTVGVPINDFGNQQPHGGDGYVGIGLYTPSPIDFREYIQTRLTTTLQPGGCYRFHIFVSLGENYSTLTTDDWGAYLSVTPLADPSSQTNFTVTPQINNSSGNVPDFLNWKFFSGFFYANGGEEYITIGNFKNNAATNTVQIASSSIWDDNIYMYIDDVALFPCQDVSLDEDQRNDYGRVFPSLFDDEIHASFEFYKTATLTIYNRFGQIILDKKLENSCTIDTGYWPPDLYFFQLQNGKSILSKGKLIKQ